MVSDSAIPWTRLCDSMDCSPQASLSMEFSRQEYWSGLPFPSPGYLSDLGIELRSPALQADSLPSEPRGKPGLMAQIFTEELLTNDCEKGGMGSEVGGMGSKVGGRFKREGTYVYLWLIHVDVWQKPTQHCKAVKKKKKKKIIAS